MKAGTPPGKWDSSRKPSSELHNPKGRRPAYSQHNSHYDDQDSPGKSIAASASQLHATHPGLFDLSANANSGENRTSADDAPDSAKWPHEWIYTTDTNAKVTPHSISLSQFVYGFLQCMDKSDPAHRPYMMAHLKASMAEVDQFGWDTVRTLHLTLFRQMESARLTWPETKGMDWYQTKMIVYNTQSHNQRSGTRATQVDVNSQL